MKPGQMIEMLQGILKRELPGLLQTAETPWQTVDVTYEDPHVERVWVQLGDFRVNLHRIHPCKFPLTHPHPWPSAVHIFSGTYQMGVGRLGQNASAEVATILLTAGSSYEMIHPHGWHYVRPIGEPSMSVMLTGKPFPKEAGIQHPGKGQNKPLTAVQKNEILAFFKKALPV